jgi:hypothetical protein
MYDEIKPYKNEAQHGIYQFISKYRSATSGIYVSMLS